MPRGSGSLPRRSRVGTASPVGEVAEALLPASPRPSGLAIGDHVRPRRPNLGRPSLGSDVARPMFSSVETSRSRGGLRSGHSRPLRVLTRVFAPQAAGREPSTCQLDLVREVFPRPGQSLDGRFSVEMTTPSRRLYLGQAPACPLTASLDAIAYSLGRCQSHPRQSGRITAGRGLLSWLDDPHRTPVLAGGAYYAPSSRTWLLFVPTYGAPGSPAATQGILSPW